MDKEKLLVKNLNVLANCVNHEKMNTIFNGNYSANGKVSTYESMRKLVRIKDVCSKCSRSSCDKSCDKENRPVLQTPQKSKSYGDPITPTANLKMLVCAASVLAQALPNIEEEKRKLFEEPEMKTETALDENDSNDSSDAPKNKLKKGELMGRKEKSLGLLCKKFIKIYPEYSENGTTILLDDVVKALSIGRRRVYDIVNVLESMEMMVRQAKNKYLWFGKSRLESTLIKLKALALRVYGPNFNHVSKQHPNAVTKIENSSEFINDETDGEPPVDALTNSIMDNIISYEQNRRDCNRSLGILCQKFLMLFMVAEEKVVTLDKAAKFLITEPDEGTGKYKTKVRRLYDIANILTSINFLEKTVSYEDSCKKAAYKWVGMDLNSLNSAEGYMHSVVQDGMQVAYMYKETQKAFQSQEFSLTRHSLLSTIPRKNFLHSQKHQLQFQNSQLKFRCRSASAHQLTSPGNHLQSTGKVKFPRTFSATTVKKEECDVDSDIDDIVSNDGFDVEKWSVETSPLPNKGEVNQSPNEALFQEKLRKLQEEFPDKLPHNGLLELLSACRNNPTKILGSRTSRRSLSSDFGNKDENIPPAKKLKVENILQQNAKIACKSPSQAEEKNLQSVSTAPIFYASLKPLISASSSAKSVLSDASNITFNTQPKPINTTGVPASGQQKFQQAAYLTIPGTFKQSNIQNTGAPMLLSPIRAPISLAKNGYYQIIPVQCRTGETNEMKSLPFTFYNANSTNQVITSKTAMQQQVFTNYSSNNITSPLPPFRAHLVASPVGSQRCVGVRAKSQLSQQQIVPENYPEFVTPPHVLIRSGNIKPQANPILFPKMTPETPSSSAPSSLMNAVTRKLMSVHPEENIL